MSLNPNLVNHGTAGGVQINVDVARIDHSITKRVQLNSSYAMLHPPGMPTRPCFTGTAVANLDYPRTVNSGTFLTLIAAEADALVAAGKASYA